MSIELNLGGLILRSTAKLRKAVAALWRDLDNQVHGLSKGLKSCEAAGSANLARKINAILINAPVCRYFRAAAPCAVRFDRPNLGLSSAVVKGDQIVQGMMTIPGSIS